MPRLLKLSDSSILVPKYSSLPLLHHGAEVAEQVMRVVRAGGGFGVVLDAEQRQHLVAQALERLVVQVDVGELDFVGVDGVGIDGEVVVVSGDLIFPLVLLRTGWLPPWWPNLSL